jgi:hypothetical protein
MMSDRLITWASPWSTAQSMAAANCAGEPWSPTALPSTSSCSLMRTGTMIAPGASPWKPVSAAGRAAMMLATSVP